MRTSTIIGLCLGTYAAYLPVAIWLHRDYIQPPRPPGMAENIVQFTPSENGYWARRSYLFNEKTISDPKRIAVLENMLPLADIDVYLNTGQYVIRFKTSDGSDPKSNGRSYWVVRQ